MCICCRQYGQAYTDYNIGFINIRTCLCPVKSSIQFNTNTRNHNSDTRKVSEELTTIEEMSPNDENSIRVLKDKNFIEKFPQGLIVSHNIYNRLKGSIISDINVSYKILMRINRFNTCSSLQRRISSTIVYLLASIKFKQMKKQFWLNRGMVFE